MTRDSDSACVRVSVYVCVCVCAHVRARDRLTQHAPGPDTPSRTRQASQTAGPSTAGPCPHRQAGSAAISGERTAQPLPVSTPGLSWAAGGRVIRSGSSSLSQLLAASTERATLPPEHIITSLSQSNCGCTPRGSLHKESASSGSSRASLQPVNPRGRREPQQPGTGAHAPLRGQPVLRMIFKSFLKMQ